MAVDHENYMNHGTYLFVYLLPSICTKMRRPTRKNIETRFEF